MSSHTWPNNISANLPQGVSVLVASPFQSFVSNSSSRTYVALIPEAPTCAGFDSPDRNVTSVPVELLFVLFGRMLQRSEIFFNTVSRSGFVPNIRLYSHYSCGSYEHVSILEPNALHSLTK